MLRSTPFVEYQTSERALPRVSMCARQIWYIRPNIKSGSCGQSDDAIGYRFRALAANSAMWRCVFGLSPSSINQMADRPLHA